MEASVQNALGGYLLPSAESLVGNHHVTGEYYPMLAIGWEMSTDAKTWTIKLREGVRWHDDHGEFTSKDVVHSLHRAVNTEDSAFPYIGRFPQLDGSPGRIVENVEAVGDYKVRFDLAFPYVRLFKALSGSEGLFITSKDHFDSVVEEAVGSDPVGTGPYHYVTFDYATSIWEFVRYHHYRANPNFGMLWFYFIEVEATRYALMATSEAYMSVVGKHLTPQASQLGLRVIQTTLPTHQLNVSFGGNYIPGTKNADGDSAVDESLPWYGTGENAINVRRALSKAIDRDALNEALYDGRGEPAYASLFHPQLGPWRDEWEGRYQEAHGYDPEGAKKLLDEAGYPNGISGYRWAAFMPGESLETNTLIEAVLGQWTKIGVSLDVEQTQRDDWFANLRNRATAGFVYAWRSPW